MVYPASESEAQPAVGAYSGRLFLAMGLVFAVSVGAIDLINATLRGPGGLEHPGYVFPPLAATVLAAWLAYVVLWAFFFLVLRRVLPNSCSRWMMAVTVGVGTLVLLGGLSDLVPKAVFQVALGKDTYFMKTAIVAAIACIAFFAAYALAGSSMRRSWAQGLVRAILLSLPFLLAVASAVVWLQKYRLDSFRSPQFLMVSAVAGLVGLLVVAAFWRLGLSRGPLAALAVLLILTLASPLSTLRGREPLRVEPPSAEPSAEAPKHVLLLVVDTLCRDALSCYGSEGCETPNMDRLAETGTVFTNAVSPSPWTLPSMASILTAVSPLTHLANERGVRVPSQLNTLAEYLNAHGYHTAAIGSNPSLTPSSNLTQGFSEYDWFPRPQFQVYSIGADILRRAFREQWRVGLGTSQITERAIAWYRANKGRHTFLWLHYLDPHMPYTPPRAFAPRGSPPPGMSHRFLVEHVVDMRNGLIVKTAEDREWVRSLYLSEVRYVDTSIGDLLGALEKMGIYDDMLIVLTSDHGEEFWEHGDFEHGHTLYRELLDVPLIFKLPEDASQETCEALVTTESILPTVLDLCRVPYEDSSVCAPPLTGCWNPGDAAPREKAVISAGVLHYEHRESVTFSGLKYIRWLISGRQELYDLTADPAELDNLASIDRDGLSFMQDQLEQFHARADELKAAYGIQGEGVIEMDETTKEGLRALGYLH